MKMILKTLAGAAMLAALTSGSAAAMDLPAPIPEFRSPQELQAEAASRAAAPKPPMAERAQIDTFYTGKPQDRESGTHVFLFRNYDPELSRWTANDPSGFPDGANNVAYLNYPTVGIDFTGLWGIKLTSPNSNPAGGSSGTVGVFTPLVTANIRASASLYTDIDSSGGMTSGTVNAAGSGRLWRSDAPSFDWLATNSVSMSISIGSDGNISVSENSGNYTGTNQDIQVAGGVQISGNGSRSVGVKFYNSAIYNGTFGGGGGWGNINVQWSGGTGMQDHFVVLNFQAVE